MLKRLKNQSLFREEGLIDGVWSQSDSKKTLAVLNPANGEVLGIIPNMGAQETRRAILAAKSAWRSWREKTARERGVILRRWFELVLEHQDDLATIMTLEQGRPFKDAKNEVIYAASFIDWYAEEGKRIYGDVIPQPQRDSRTLVLKESIGVCGAITPWNMPSAMVTRKTATALAAGCTVVLKPAEQTPYSAIALAVLAQEAGVPKGVFNLVTGDPEPIGMELTTNRIVRKITFTGSTEVGKILMRQSSNTIKKLSFELGGNSPFIVFDDADIKKAAKDDDFVETASPWSGGTHFQGKERKQ
jgi:succinate-semialdehyde dehydrogenase/glutarate-semialdehyde dehydrogenase